MKNKRTLYRHSLGWGLLLAYTVIGQIIDDSRYGVFLYTIMLVHFIEFYICYLWVFPRFLKKGKTVQLILGIVAAMASFITVRYLIEEVFLLYFWGMHNYGDDTTAANYILDNLYWGTSYIFISAAVWSTEAAFKREQENKTLRETAVQAELAFLKSQINPHFLYNTLNYIYSLAYPVSDKLADAIIKLSNLMRYMLTDSNDGMIDLQKEVDYLHNYIEIYRLRFEDNFHVAFTTSGDIAGKRLASLVLIPFVENAFKHGVVDDARRPVKINLQLTGNRLSFIVSNKINHNQKDHSSGVGLVNIRRRLELIYPERHELLIADNGETYKTTLIINL